MTVTAADFGEWKDSFVSRWWFGEVARMRQELVDVLTSRGTVNSGSIEATAIQTIDLTGKIQVLDEVLNLKVEGEGE